MSSEHAGSNDQRRKVTQRTIDEFPDATSAVVDAIASAEQIEPTALPAQSGICLYDHINPEALDRMFAPDRARGNVRVTFTVENYEIRIDRQRVTVYNGTPSVE